MNDYGLVSIITPTWACAKFIGETIKSIQTQTYTNWELLIQDDCSTDGTDKVVKPFQEMDSRIKYECNLKNSGAAITRNNALKRAKGSGLLSLILTTSGCPRSWRSNLDSWWSTNMHSLITNIQR